MMAMAAQIFSLLAGKSWSFSTSRRSSAQPWESLIFFSAAVISRATAREENAGSSAALDAEQADHRATKKQKKNLATQSSLSST
jgi:hypothetical protein